MAKIACLLPRLEMVEQAQKILEELEITNVVGISHGNSVDAIEWVKNIAKQDVDIIIARGLQATYIKRQITLPVIEMRLTAQEMGLLVQQGKKLVSHKPHPIVGIVGYSNQFANMDDFPEIFDIELRTYFVQKEESGPEKLRALAHQAISEGPDFLIGGDTLLEEAKRAGIPSLFLSGLRDSFREALRTARAMSYAIDQEKANTAEMKTMLDNSFGAMAKLDSHGNIAIVNHVAENLLDWHASTVVGKPIRLFAEAIDTEMLREVLVRGREIYAKYVVINKVSVLVNLSPIQSDGTITGALFSAQEVKRLEDMGTIARKELFWKGHIAKAGFDNMNEPSSAARRATALARQFAQSIAPVFLCSETGNGQNRFAQAIHNASERKNGPFVSLNCAQDAQEGQLAMLFGTGSTEGVLAQAHQGTIYLEEIEALSSPCQHRLMTLMKEKAILGSDHRMLPLDVRIIVTSGSNFEKLIEDRIFSQELYYLLNNLYLEIPPLRRRPEDIIYWAAYFVELFGKYYKRYISLTAGGRKKLENYPWKGNLTQLASFCERLVLTAPRRSTDENAVEHLYLQMYPITIYNPPATTTVIYKDPEAALIAGLLEKHNGRRSAVAYELGVSATTLWRKIKKYDILNKFDL